MHLERHACRPRLAFSLLELLVTIAVISVLAALLLTGVAKAKSRAQTVHCQNNLRQIGLGLTAYMTENKDFPGGALIERDDGGRDYYVWPARLLQHVGSRAVFRCPAAPPDSAWDTNLNKTLGVTPLGGTFDAFGITDSARFSIGYNDWGVGQGQIALSNAPQLGLGGDVSGRYHKGPVAEPQIADPSAMIALGDSKVDGFWDGSLDPTEPGQWPSNRHDRKANLQFLDGHSESVSRKAVIDSKPNNPWRRRWNIDNLPHNEITWTVDWTVEAKIEKE